MARFRLEHEKALPALTKGTFTIDFGLVKLSVAFAKFDRLMLSEIS